MNFLGQNIRHLRRQHSNTQTELAALIQKGQTTIGNWENGISEPNVEELLILSNYFDISLDILIKVDLSKTNWVSVKNHEQGIADPASNHHTVIYDHSGMEESMVQEKDRDDLAYVVKEISSLRDEIRHIQSRLDNSGNKHPEKKKLQEYGNPKEYRKSIEDRKPVEDRKSIGGGKSVGGGKSIEGRKSPKDKQSRENKKLQADKKLRGQVKSGEKGKRPKK